MMLTTKKTYKGDCVMKSAMLAADTELDIRSGSPAFLNSHLHQLANAVLVQSCKRVNQVSV